MKALLAGAGALALDASSGWACSRSSWARAGPAAPAHPPDAEPRRPTGGRGVLGRDRLRPAVGRHPGQRDHRDRPEPHRRTARARGRGRPERDPAAQLRARAAEPVRDDAAPSTPGDTGGAIIGRHVDIYDWRGRASQDAWGERARSPSRRRRTPAPGTCSAPSRPTAPADGRAAAACQPALITDRSG